MSIGNNLHSRSYASDGGGQLAQLIALTSHLLCLCGRSKIEGVVKPSKVGIGRATPSLRSVKLVSLVLQP